MEAITAGLEEPAVTIPQAHPVQVIGGAAMRNQATGDGVDCSRDRPREGKGSNAGTGPKGDRGGSNVTFLLLGGSKSQDGEKPWRRGVDRKESASLRDAGTEQSEPGTGEKKAVFGLWTTHQEASQATGPGV